MTNNNIINLYKILLFTLWLTLFLLPPMITVAQQTPVDNEEYIAKKVKHIHGTPDTIPRKRFGRAVAMFTAMEVLPWMWDKYLKKADYAQISFGTVGHNLNPGSWEWDDDNFQTNQFGHPYHGSFFFNSFRTNGYTFWQSVPAVFAGSYIWETFAEKQAPAPNDFINTSFGGIILGEMTYRLSNRIINNRTHGFKRQMSEVIGLLVDPLNGITRITDGKWGRIYGNPSSRDSSHINLEFDIGARNFDFDNRGKFGGYGRIKLLYGTPSENYRTPFSNISVLTEFGQDDSSKVNIISVYGSLAGWKIYGKNNTHLAILSANYDYIHNVAFFYGGQSVKMNLYSKFEFNKKFSLNTAFGAGPVILAAVPDPYLHDGNRNYDYGPGFALNGDAQIDLFNKLYMGVSYRGGWMETVNGNPSHYFIHAASSEISYKFVKAFSLCVEGGYFDQRGYYKHFARVNNTYPYVRLSVRYATEF